MPIIKRAIKKLRHDIIRTRQNRKTRNDLGLVLKKARKSPNASSLSRAFSALDRAAKRNIIHKKTADRTKSRLAKLLK